MAKETDEKRMATDVIVEVVKKYSIAGDPGTKAEKIVEAWKKIYEAIKES